MDAVRLRVMARKSVFTSGKYENFSVQQVINLKGYHYLIWCYFNQSNISFLPDILDELHITEELRIEKPGTNVEKGNLVAEMRRKRFNAKLHAVSMESTAKGCIMYNKHLKNMKIYAKDMYRSMINYDNMYFSKGSMQARNHGHF